MATRLDVPFNGSFASKRSPNETFEYLAHFEGSVPKNIPGLETFKKRNDGTYEWAFEKFGLGGFEFQILLVTRFELSPPDKITIVPAGSPDESAISGFWQVQDGSVNFSVLLDLVVPIPGFLKSMAKPVAQKEINHYFNRYLKNVEKVLSE